MDIKRLSTMEEVGRMVGERVLSLMKENACICLASGETMDVIFEYIVKEYQANPFPIQADFVGLDEWVGMDKHDVGSCQYYMFRDFYEAVPIPPEKLVVFNAKSSDLTQECQKMEKHLQGKPIDLMVLGIGVNGHLGLNEPGCDFAQGAHIAPLSDVTKQVAQKYFSENTQLEQGITLGIQTIMDTREVMLVATGERKRDIIEKLLVAEVDPRLPASILKQHGQCCLFTDQREERE